MKIHHTPVLADETIQYVRPTDVHLFDGTFGHAGHSILALDKAPQSTLDATDRDTQASDIGMDHVQQAGLSDRVRLHHRSYADVQEIALSQGILYDYILIDIGVNLQHFMDGERGFSIKRDGPLDMRFDTTQKLTAHKIVNEYRVQQLTDLFVAYGDYRDSRAKLIAETIHNHRKNTPIMTTFALVAALESARCNAKDQSIIFQCIRIETNNELKELEQFLSIAPQACAPQGRIAVITFHSTEDRIVKFAMQSWVEQGLGQILTKHVIKPSFAEIKRNPPSRSAKLRVFELDPSN